MRRDYFGGIGPVSKNYSVNFRHGLPMDLSKSEFDRLRAMSRLFAWKPNRPKRITLKPAYVAWIEEGEFRFQEKLTQKIIRFVRSPEDSCVRVERLCSAQNPQYIKDDAKRQREIWRQYS